jgi:hypothetical protein
VRPTASAALGFVTAVLTLLVGRTAMACPTCATRDDQGGVALLFVYAAMVLAPFLATYVVIRVIKAMTSDDRRHKPAAAHPASVSR